MRLLPHAIDAEKGLLCSFLNDPVSVGSLCAGRGISTAHFHIPGHATIFTHIMDCWTKGTPADFITITNALRVSGVLESVGGAAYVTELFVFLPTAANAEHYADICEEKRILRAIVTLCTEYSSRANDETDAPHALAEEAASKICSIAISQAASRQPMTPKEMALDATERAEHRSEKRGLADYTMRTGISGIDEAMSGIRKGDFVLISGKEKSGKTSLAFNIMQYVVFSQGKRAIVASLEMKLPEITDRMLSSMGQINFTNILNGWMSEEECNHFTAQALRLAGGKFQIRDDVFSLAQIVSAFRQYKAAHPDLEFGIVDYLQLVDAERVTRDDNREQIIARTSRTLRRLASELDIALLLLVQLNEDGQVRESRAPGMDCTAHIRIEPGDEEGKKWARIVYQRNGPSNIGVPLAHLGQFLTFRQAAHQEAPTPAPKKKRKWNGD